MPTGIHEIFIRKVDLDIMSQLDAIDVDIAREIESLGSTDLIFETSKHSPDSSYACDDSRYPHVVMEVSYSQKQKDLPGLADTYIVESDGKIGVVIGLDIEYKTTKKATLSIWRPRDVVEGDKVYLESQCIKSKVKFKNFS